MKTDFNLRKLDSLTKYPSILTYHTIGDKGRLNEELTYKDVPEDLELVGTEKIDGENSRVLFLVKDGCVDYFIGTRDELIYAVGDRVQSKKGNMVATVKPYADRVCVNKDFLDKYNNKLVVIFTESYGGNIAKSSKQYTSSKVQSIRMFDSFNMNLSDVKDILEMDLDKVASWRDHVGQPFISETGLFDLSKLIDIPLTPRRCICKKSDIHSNIEDVYKWLLDFKTSLAGIDKTDGQSEGIVLRNFDRSFIVKLRFEDYERTLNYRR